MSNVFDEMGIFWAEMADQNQTEAQLKFLKTQLKPNSYILDVACGTGRHTIPLSQVGFNMVGLDVSAKLLKIANQRWRGVQVVRGDMRFLPFKAEAFAAAVSMDTSIGYLPSVEDDAQSLTEIHRVLKRGGSVVLDVFNRQNLTAKYQGKNQPSKPREYPSFSLVQTRTVNDNGDWLCDTWTVHDKVSGEIRVFEHTVRLYETVQLQSMLEKSGFAVLDVYGGYGLEVFSSDSPRLIIVAKRK